jgi:hypothetical protein
LTVIDAFVAYVDTGSAWVAGGAPVTSPERLVEVARSSPRPHARRAARELLRLRATLRRREHAARDPSESSRSGRPRVGGDAGEDVSLRYQLRAHVKRASRSGGRAAELADPSAPLHAAIAALRQWLATRKMAPMGFLVQLEPLTFSEERVLLVAERGGAIVGFLSAVPVYARRRLFVEDILRTRTAPNGTTELLVDAAMRAAATRGDLGVTLGLAPLAGPVAPLLRLARTLTRPLYDFRGVHAFKAKLRPEHWEPVYVCATSPWLGLRDGLAAFAGGSLIEFGLKTLTRRRLPARRAGAAGVRWTHGSAVRLRSGRCRSWRDQIATRNPEPRTAVGIGVFDDAREVQDRDRRREREAPPIAGQISFEDGFRSATLAPKRGTDDPAGGSVADWIGHSRFSALSSFLRSGGKCLFLPTPARLLARGGVLARRASSDHRRPARLGCSRSRTALHVVSIAVTSADSPPTAGCG